MFFYLNNFEYLTLVLVLTPKPNTGIGADTRYWYPAGELTRNNNNKKNQPFTFFACNTS